MNDIPVLIRDANSSACILFVQSELVKEKTVLFAKSIASSTVSTTVMPNANDRGCRG